MALQIWLLNPYQLHYNWSELCTQVAALMKPVVDQYDSASKVKLSSVAVNNRYTKPSITPKDLAVYVVPTPFYGFIGTDFGSSGHRREAGGLTSPPSGGQSCSEVYVGGQEVGGTAGEFIRVDTLENESKGVLVDAKATPKLLAKIVYHELMHYVTPKWSAEKLHHYKGVSLGKESTKENTPQSKADIEILANHLASHGQQFWTGAWDAMRGRGYKV